MPVHVNGCKYFFPKLNLICRRPDISHAAGENPITVFQQVKEKGFGMKRFAPMQGRLWTGAVVTALLLPAAILPAPAIDTSGRPLLTVSIPTQAQAQNPTLTGSVRETVYEATSTQGVGGPGGWVRDNATGQPLRGVTVSIPSLGIGTQTDEQGRFTLPAEPDKPSIASFSKPGYLSTSVTVQPGQAEPFRIRLQRHQAASQLVLDEQLRHLGDNSYSPHSAGAARFRRSAEGTALVRPFRLINPPPDAFVTLRIGTVLGLDTQAAHATGQSAFHHASSPMLIHLNGTLVNRIDVNGDGITLRLPAHLMREYNTLVIETGHHRPDGTYVDYDDVELMHLVLEF